MAIYSNFEQFPGISFEDPIIDEVGEITIPKNYLSVGTVSLWVYFQEIPAVIGRFAIQIKDMPVNDYNGEQGNIEDRIWDYLNDPANGHIQ